MHWQIHGFYLKLKLQSLTPRTQCQSQPQHSATKAPRILSEQQTKGIEDNFFGGNYHFHRPAPAPERGRKIEFDGKSKVLHEANRRPRERSERNLWEVPEQQLGTLGDVGFQDIEQ